MNNKQDLSFKNENTQSFSCTFKHPNVQRRIVPQLLLRRDVFLKGDGEAVCRDVRDDDVPQERPRRRKRVVVSRFVLQNRTLRGFVRSGPRSCRCSRLAVWKRQRLRLLCRGAKRRPPLDHAQVHGLLLLRVAAVRRSGGTPVSVLVDADAPGRRGNRVGAAATQKRLVAAPLLALGGRSLQSVGSRLASSAVGRRQVRAAGRR